MNVIKFIYRLPILLCILTISTLGYGDELSTSADEIQLNQYIISAGDILSISVWGEPELVREVLVLPDLTLSFPLAGVLSASNMTVSSLTKNLEDKIKLFIPDASVQIAIKQIRGSKIFVLGNVNRPGEYPLYGELTVLQALSISGGMSTFADEDSIKIIRNSEKGQAAILFNYSDIAKGKHLEQNIPLRSGDVILVP
tara:strand:+ start:799 stop:1392 length:594 start_codon:yes stop_codon:yes gene_type:complete